MLHDAGPSPNVERGSLAPEKVDAAIVGTVTERPWSNTQMRRLGVSLREGSPLPSNTPTYDEVALWYLDRTVEIQDRIRRLEWVPLIGAEEVRVSSRVKTIGTLVEKLRRNPGYALQSIRDIAGVRLEAHMSLATQTAVCETLCGVFGAGCEVSVVDLRDAPHFGYRAVHLELRHPGHGWRAEIQVRTDLQGKWANMYEVAGDILGRSIRYVAIDPTQAEHSVVEALQRLSTEKIATFEAQYDRVTAQELRVDDIRRGIIAGDLGEARSRLQSLREAVEPATIALSDQLESLTIDLQRIRASKG